MPAEELKRKLGAIAEQIEAISDPKAAFDKAKAYGGDIFIGGSLYLAREIRPYILGE